jgi:hypothetical protein
MWRTYHTWVAEGQQSLEKWDDEWCRCHHLGPRILANCSLAYSLFMVGSSQLAKFLPQVVKPGREAQVAFHFMPTNSVMSYCRRYCRRGRHTWWQRSYVRLLLFTHTFIYNCYRCCYCSCFAILSCHMVYSCRDCGGCSGWSRGSEPRGLENRGLWLALQIVRDRCCGGDPLILLSRSTTTCDLTWLVNQTTVH